MSFARWTAGVLVCLFAAATGGCGSDGDQTAGIEGTGASDGVEGTGASDGSASGFGSVFVNGVEFDTSGAEIVIDGAPATEDGLRIGMVLRVTGFFHRDGRRGTAGRVAFDRRLAGPVEEVAPDKNRIRALGQTVRIDANTVFVNASPDTLETQDLVVLSGFMKSGDELLATLVERRPDAYVPGVTPVDVEGIVRYVAFPTCRIGNLTVDYTAAVLDMEGGPLRNGALVEAQGHQPEPRGTLYASRIVVKNPAVGAPGERAELSGLMADFAGLESFSIGGQTVDASGAVRTDDTTAAPANDVHVEVEGVIDENGRLVAESFALRPPSDIHLAGGIDSVDEAGEGFVISGTAVAVEATTQYEDRSSAGLRTFRVDDLRPGDTADVRGFRDADGKVVATRVIRLSASAP